MAHKMRLLVEYSHPAQVHKFKYVLPALVARGWDILILSRDKDVMLELLNKEPIPHVCLSKAGKGLVAMAFELLRRELKSIWYFYKFKPNLALSAHSIAISHISKLFGIPCVIHEDTEHAKLQQRLYMPFATHIITSTSYTKDWGKRQIRINSIEPLAYLHPNNFSPESNVLKKYGLTPGTRFAVIRFIAWQAAHDTGFEAPSHNDKEYLITSLLEAGAERIVLTCEDANLIKSDKIISIEPQDLHHVLAFASLCVSEGGSVANEAAVLGVPTVLLNPLQVGMSQELERYSLLVQAPSFKEGIASSLTLWNDDGAKARQEEFRKKLLTEKKDMANELVNTLIKISQENTSQK